MGFHLFYFVIYDVDLIFIILSERRDSMEYKLHIIQDPYTYEYIVTIDGLPGCITKAKSLSNAISNVYKELDCWKKSAFLSGFDCFKACLSENSFSSQKI